jgi:hypothetical protein
MTSHELFGGLSIVFFADLLQLPPVKGNQPFIPVTFLEAKQRLGAVASLDIWQSFKYDELTINMRQRSDNNYADLLSSVRVGSISDQQYSLLTERLISPGRRATVNEVIDRYQQLVNDGQSPLILMPTTALCKEINTAMLKKIGNDIHTISAIDTLDTVVTKQLMSKVEAAHKKLDDDVTRTAGLEKNLQLCIGARVMLKRNKDVELGLVNGSVGAIVEFTITQVHEAQSHVASIHVKFDKIDRVINVVREAFSFEVLKSVFYTRQQFPLMAAFAITIHKSQGLSLESAIVDAGNATFGPAMIYVGLSRITTLNGLHLVDINRQKIKCDRKALQEYNRLRQLYMPHIAELVGHDIQLNDSDANGNSTKCTTEMDVTLHANASEARTKIGSDVQHKTVPGKGISAEAKRQKYKKIETNQEKPPKKLRALKTQQKTVRRTSKLPLIQQSIFTFCSSQSLHITFQQQVCRDLNLSFNNELLNTLHTDRGVARLLAAAIHQQTHRTYDVTIYQMGTDGNCLFRALSMGITGSQSQHSLIRDYLVNHMQRDTFRDEMAQLFENRQGQQATTYDSHLAAMQQTGTWGTEQEIVAAANLFNCSILCYSKNNGRNFWLQHFSPHYASQPDCTSYCNHASLFLVNSCGSHYNFCTAFLNDDVEE